MFFSKCLVFSPFSGPGHVPITRIPTPAAWHMESHRLPRHLAVLRASHWQLLLMDVPCVSVHSRCISSHKTGAYTLSFFEIRGSTVQPRLSRSGLSNYNIQGVHSPARGILLYFSSLPWPESVQLVGFVFRTNSQSALHHSGAMSRECTQLVGFVFRSLLYTTEAAMYNQLYDMCLIQMLYNQLYDMCLKVYVTKLYITGGR